MGVERAAGEVDRRLGERVRARRHAIGMSQEQLADLVGITFQQVQKYEMGFNRIAASRLLDIAAALETPVTYFYEGLTKSRRKAKARAEDLLAQHGAAELVRLYASIEHDHIRRRVLDLVRAMTRE